MSRPARRRRDPPRRAALAGAERPARGDGDRWLHLRIDTALHADRLSWTAYRRRRRGERAGAALPKSLRLPLEIEVASASIDELRIGASAEATRRCEALRGRVHLGADGGARHRFDDLAASYEPRCVTGSGSIGADAAVRGDARRDPRPPSTEPPCRAQASLGADGPLEALNVRAQARVAAGASHAAQALDAHAVVRPFAAWPLGELQATTDALDLSVFASAAPATALSGARRRDDDRRRSAGDVVSLDLANGFAAGLLERRPAAGTPTSSPKLRCAAERARIGSRSRRSAPSSARPEATAGASSAPASGRATAGRSPPSSTSPVRPSALRRARCPKVALLTARRRSSPAPASRTARSSALVAITADLAGQFADPRLPKKRAAQRSLAPRRDRGGRHDRRARRRSERRRDAREPRRQAAAQRERRAVAREGGRIKLAAFDPALWWPGSAGSTPLARGPNRLDAQGEFDLALPPAGLALYDALRGGRAAAHRSRSPRARSPASPSKATRASSTTTAAPARRSISSPPATAPTVKGRSRRAAAATRRLAADRSTRPRSDRLAPWLGVAATARTETLAGALTAKAHVGGRWPAVRATGELHGTSLRYQTLTMRRAEGRWQLGTQGDAPLDATIALDGIDASGRAIEHAGAAHLGHAARAHRGELRIESAALPPGSAGRAGGALECVRHDDDGGGNAVTGERAHGDDEHRDGEHDNVARADLAQHRRRRRRRRPRRRQRRAQRRLARQRARAVRAKPRCADAHLAARARRPRQRLLGRRPGAREPRGRQCRSARRDAALEPHRLARRAARRERRPPRRAGNDRPAAAGADPACAGARLRLGRRPRRRRAHRRAQRPDDGGRRRRRARRRGRSHRHR